MWLFLLACADAPPPTPAATETLAPMDGLPARSTPSPAGWTAEVLSGGRLLLRDENGNLRARVDEGVLAQVAWSTDGQRLAYATRGEDGVETDLKTLTLDDPRPRKVVAWRGAEDRPVFSPEGDRLAFVSGVTGIASVWVVDLPDPIAPVSQDRATPLTNEGVRVTVPGQAPDGFVPPPESDFVWTADGLSWQAHNEAGDLQTYSVQSL